jgi:predicted TIM-barrel fold metal-dependent hydrolase
MRILDGHIHIIEGGVPHPEMVNRMQQAGVSGGVVISRPPAAYSAVASPAPPARRMEEAASWAFSGSELYPFFWIDPTEADAVQQVEMAMAGGAAGFKVICHAFEPGDARAIPVYRAIAKHDRPILFHSGILWDGRASSRYCRPVLFEDLLEVEGLKFALAHVSWPWYDECIAVYGKYLNALTRRSELNVEMFIDLTPGTPPIYRQDMITKLMTVGYDIEHNLIFGTDCVTSNYNVKSATEWIERDTGIYRSLGVDQQVVEDIFANNLLRFLGKGTSSDRRSPGREEFGSTTDYAEGFLEKR